MTSSQRPSLPGHYTLRVGCCFSVAMTLPLAPEPCNRLHGYSYRLDMVVRTLKTDASGISVDVVALEQLCQQVVRELDHRCLNDHPDFGTSNPPSTEHVVRWCCKRLIERLDGTDATLVEASLTDVSGRSVAFTPDPVVADS